MYIVQMEHSQEHTLLMWNHDGCCYSCPKILFDISIAILDWTSKKKKIIIISQKCQKSFCPTFTFWPSNFNNDSETEQGTQRLHGPKEMKISLAIWHYKKTTTDWTLGKKTYTPSRIGERSFLFCSTFWTL